MEMAMLNERIKEDLLKRYEAMREHGELLSRARLEAAYLTFRRRFGPEVLASLDGEALLRTMHEHGNHDSLVYWLEFKNDEEFPGRFGSIAGGSALKFGLYLRQETGIWMTGSSQHQRELSLQEAQEIARRHRDQLLQGSALLEQLPLHADDTGYRRLQEELAKAAPDVSRLSWGHKYFSLLHPEKLDDFHAEDLQRFHLIKLLQTPPEGEGRYLCAGRYVAIATELGLPMNHLTALLNHRDGGVACRYWRIGTRLGERQSIWGLMRDSGCVAIGWSHLGDLSADQYDRGWKERVREALRPEYAKAPGVLGQKTQEVANFVAAITEDDLVLAADGKRILGIGRVTGGYQHRTGEDAPHRRPVTWLSLEEWELPATEGLRTTVHQVRKDVQNLLAIERRLLSLPPPLPDARGALALDGVPGRIQAVLERKRQVILYGPPGTGKTYWARSTALDIAAHDTFGASFDNLTPEQQDTIHGEAGLVRLCAFHPAYGYEDFLEGYRPQTQSGQLTFELRDGIFKRLCDDARKQPSRRFFLIVDEINRGDIPRIFGELLTVLERDKRGRPIVLPLSGLPFSVPDNVYLIGTMNTADRSIALLDTALRRRFGFVELMPSSATLGKAVLDGVPLGPWLDALNRRICEHIGRDARNLQIGHAYLMEGAKPVADFARFARILQDDVLPLLEEYCYEDLDSLEKILGSGLVDRETRQIRHELFDTSRRSDLVPALLAPAPDIATSSAAISAAGSAPEDPSTETSDDGVGDSGETPDPLGQ